MFKTYPPPQKKKQDLDQVTPPNHKKKKNDESTPPKTSAKDFVGFFSTAKSGTPTCSLQLCFVFLGLPSPVFSFLFIPLIFFLCFVRSKSLGSISLVEKKKRQHQRKNRSKARQQKNGRRR